MRLLQKPEENKFIKKIDYLTGMRIKRSNKILKKYSPSRDSQKHNNRYKTFDDTSSVETIKFHSNSKECLFSKNSKTPTSLNLKLQNTQNNHNKKAYHLLSKIHSNLAKLNGL
mmetsp:Transcript_31066/g.27476  ORF Transcript_31066/g.27476 Transcript_31066/m.27476 type:complete len:113 (+) Transcript_31066:707-1045(+)